MAMTPGTWGGGLGLVREPFAGAWQRNRETRTSNVLTHTAVYRCVNMISSDIAKMGLNLVELGPEGIWHSAESPAFSPVLRKPNHYQTRIQFIEQWVISKLVHGNTYILKERDARNVITSLYVLDPTRTWPLVADDGSVFYQISSDNLAGVGTGVTVPASEIIHDIMSALYHPLVGVSPITSCALSAAVGLKMQEHSGAFFANGATPGGILTAPAHIPQETANRIKKDFETKYGGLNLGRIAVLGDGLDYKAMSMTAVDAQLIQHLKWTAEPVCTAFGVPAYKIGVGVLPAHNNIAQLDQQYYSQCLQILIEAMEICLNEGLELPKTYGTNFNIEDLIRMDASQRIDASVKSISGGLFSTNEERARFDRKAVPGGDDVRAQQQLFSLAALAERDKNKPFAKPTTPPPAIPSKAPGLPPPLPSKGDDVEEKLSTEETAVLAGAYLRKELGLAA